MFGTGRNRQVKYVADAFGCPVVYGSLPRVTCDARLWFSLALWSNVHLCFYSGLSNINTSASCNNRCRVQLEQLVPSPATNYQPASTTKFPAAAVDATCFCAVAILFVVSLLALVIVAAIAIATVLVAGAKFVVFFSVIAVAVLVAVTGDFLRRFAFVRNFRSFVFLKPVLIAAGCSLSNRRLPLIRSDVLRPGDAPVKSRASARWTKLSFTAQLSNNPCNSVCAICFPLLIPLPLPSCPVLACRMFELLAKDCRSERLPVSETSRTSALTPQLSRCFNR